MTVGSTLLSQNPIMAKDSINGSVSNQNTDMDINIGDPDDERRSYSSVEDDMRHYTLKEFHNKA